MIDAPTGGSGAPFRPVAFAAPAVDVERRDDGTLILSSARPLGSHERHVGAYLRRWGRATPNRVFLAQRVGRFEPGQPRPWRNLTYGQALAGAEAIAQALIDRGLGLDRPVMLLSGNSIEHALLTFGAMLAGVPAVPVSPAYSLMSADLAKMRYVAELIRPAVVFAQHGQQFERALRLMRDLDIGPVELVVVEAPADGIASTGFDTLLETPRGADVDRMFDAVGPDTVAKILFTSGSTGMPKGVINTQRMLCANQKMAELTVPPDPAKPPVTLDWLPWNHTFGGNYNIHATLRTGGTLYIDGGRPVPGLFAETVENLREISTTSFSNVPVGYAMLATELENDAALRQCFFRDLKMLGYGGAAMPRPIWQRMQDLAVRTIGERIVFTTGWGSTETAPTATLLHWPVEGTGVIGLPFPGVSLRLVPVGKRYELRLKGPIVFPGYHKRPDPTAAAFDEDGFYKIGDAGRLVDPSNPAKGLMFDGRVVEDFKLMSGTFVQVGALRIAALAAAAPALQDAIVAGQDRPYVGLLAWPNVAACRALAGKPAAGMAELARDPAVLAHVAAGLKRHNAGAGGSSERIDRFLLLRDPPVIDANEITDKGYINQRAALEHRAAELAALHADPPGAGVVVLTG